MILRRHWIPPVGFHEALAAEILRRADRFPTTPSHNRGGWRSGDDLLDWPLPEIELLRSRVQVALGEASDLALVVRRAWALVNRDRSFHGRHVHNATWSAIYYVAGTTGATIFESFDGEQAVTPEPGLLVMFPSHIWHRTMPCDGSEARITIAFDAS